MFAPAYHCQEEEVIVPTALVKTELCSVRQGYDPDSNEAEQVPSSVENQSIAARERKDKYVFRQTN